jgi:hypothetical protein
VFLVHADKHAIDRRGIVLIVPVTSAASVISVPGYFARSSHR